MLQCVLSCNRLMREASGLGDCNTVQKLTLITYCATFIQQLVNHSRFSPLREEDLNFKIFFLEIISSKHLFVSSLRHQSEGGTAQYFLKYLEIGYIIEIQNLNELNVSVSKLQQSSSVALWRKVDFSSFNGPHQDSAKICHHSFLSCIS